MKRLWKNSFVRWVVLPVLFFYGWYQLAYPSCAFRYKMTAELMTPQGLKTSSSVVQVSYRNVYSISGAPNHDLHARGEAVFIPIDEKRLFAVTLTNWEAKRAGKQNYGITRPHNMINGALNIFGLPLKTFQFYWNGNDERGLCRQVNEFIKLGGGRRAAPLENLPTLVVFQDINDPDSVEVVQPESLSATLGEGYKLQNVWLEITYDWPTNNGMDMFPWWNEKVEEWKAKWIFRHDDKLIDLLYYRAFKEPTIKGTAKK